MTYEETCRTFRWRAALAALGWESGGTVNLGHTILDRHRDSHRVALYWFGKSGARRRYTFGDLSRLSDRFAGALYALGVHKGDRVAGFLPRVPETIVTMVGTWKVGAIYVPIFTGFGADAIQFRVRHSGARVLCTHWEHRPRLPADLAPVEAVVTIAGPRGLGVEPGDVSFWHAVEQAAAEAILAPCRRDERAVLLYTSGSTGPPKSVQIVQNFLVAIYPWLRYGMDLVPGDLVWPTGDPGWGYGLICYMGALALGTPVTMVEATPTAALCLSLLAEHEVTSFATTPTVLRGLMALGADAVRQPPPGLRVMGSVGEPLNAEVVAFFRRQWRLTPVDQYGASEVGLSVGNYAGVEMQVRPGSMGRPMPGLEVAIVDDAGRELAPGEVGQIALRPSAEGYYALGYWADPERTREVFGGEWITIGDLGRRDEAGYMWFEGRSDDVIKSAGYRIGPFEVESAILNHPAVAEAAVVGKPDPLRGQIVKAYVVLKPGATRAEGLEDEIVDVVRGRVGRHQYPREIEVVDQLPKTETGKIQRFLLRQP